jgi:hypothetical protein
MLLAQRLKSRLLAFAFGGAVFLSLLCGGSATASAQDDKLKDFTFEDVPTEDARPPYFVAGGGFVAMPIFQDFAKLNETVRAVTGETLGAPLWMYGAQGFVTPGILNLRLGFISAGGSAVCETNVGGITKRAEYAMTMNGLTVDYAFSPFKGFVILPGDAWCRNRYLRGEPVKRRPCVRHDVPASAVADELPQHNSRQSLFRAACGEH